MPYLRRKRNIRIERPESRIGAIVTGLDVNRLAADEWRALYDAWLLHNVLVVRGQDLGIEQFLAYSALFGRLKPHCVRRTRHPKYPELTVTGENVRKAGGNVDASIRACGQKWHTDGGRHALREHVRGIRCPAAAPEEANRRTEGGVRPWRAHLPGRRSRRPAAASRGAFDRSHP